MGCAYVRAYGRTVTWQPKRLKSICEMNLIWTAGIQMKWRCDHRSRNRNLSNCNFFRAKISSCLNCDYNCDDRICSSIEINMLPNFLRYGAPLACAGVPLKLNQFMLSIEPSVIHLLWNLDWWCIHSCCRLAIKRSWYLHDKKYMEMRWRQKIWRWYFLRIKVDSLD